MEDMIAMSQCDETMGAVRNKEGEAVGYYNKPVPFYKVPTPVDGPQCVKNYVYGRTGKPQTFEQALDEVLQEIRSTMLERQRDYGSGNINAFGELGVMVRASDKIERLKNQHKIGATPAGESLDNNWIDLAGYSTIALMLRRGTWGLPLEEK